MPWSMEEGSIENSIPNTIQVWAVHDGLVGCTFPSFAVGDSILCEHITSPGLSTQQAIRSFRAIFTFRLLFFSF